MAAARNIFGWSAKEKARKAELVRGYKAAGAAARAATRLDLQAGRGRGSSGASTKRGRKTPDELNREFLERQGGSSKRPKSATFKGRKIDELPDGSWVIPSIDRESHFDSLQDAKAFITSWKRNPKSVIKAGGFVVLSSSAPGVPSRRVPVKTGDQASAVVLRYIDSYGLGASTWTGGNLLDSVGRVIGHVSYNGRVWGADGLLLQEAVGRSESAFAEAKRRKDEKVRGLLNPSPFSVDSADYVEWGDDLFLDSHDAKGTARSLSRGDAKRFIAAWRRWAPKRAENPAITDRAHRYRANNLMPSGPKVCALCGSKKNVVPDHKDGHPDHTTPSNLQWLCKSCNTAKGFWMRDHGKGRLTHQYNPAEGVPTYQQYAWAVSQHSPGAHDEGGAIIHATPKKLRSEYAAMIADTKRSRWRMADDERWNPAQVVPPNLRPATGQDRCGTCGFFNCGQCMMFGGFPVIASQVCDDYVQGVPGTMISNPSQFDRCVREVEARGGDVNAYAVCTAAGTRNPKTPGVAAVRRWMHYSTATLRGMLDLPEQQVSAATKRSIRRMLEYRNELAQRRNNPESSAASLYESFHGVPSTQTLEVEEQEADHEHLTLLGRLVDCYVITLTGLLAHFEFDEDPPVWLSSAESGGQLYFAGGDQEIDLAALKMDGPEWVKDRMVIGQFAPPICGKCGTEFEKRGKVFTCPKCGHKATYEDHDAKDVVYNLSYSTKKTFDDMAQIDYQHDLGEDTGVRPMLEYDPRTRHLFVTGGRYFITQPLFGVSPGIEN